MTAAFVHCHWSSTYLKKGMNGYILGSAIDVVEVQVRHQIVLLKLRRVPCLCNPTPFSSYHHGYQQ